MSIKNDGHYFCRAGGNRPDGLNEPVTYILRAWLPRSCLKTFFLVTVSLSASFLHCWQVW
ncbi:hypothetical protein CTZ35_23910 [Escherichia coli]|nr:hypothetical protein CTZ35_23910 [Escherichia coli]